MDPGKTGVFLCRGGISRADTREFNRLRLAAEAAGAEHLFEVLQICQVDGASAVRRLAEEFGLKSLVVGACPLGDNKASILSELNKNGVEIDHAAIRDLPEWTDLRNGQVCRIAADAEKILEQAITLQALNQIPAMETMVVSTTVLVVGHGLMALATAHLLSGIGYRVVMTSPDRHLAPPEPLLGGSAAALAAVLAEAVDKDVRISVIRQGEMLSLTGTAGRFLARIFDRQNVVHEHEIGAVVVAQGPPRTMNLAGLDIEASDKVKSLSEMISLIGSPEYLKKYFSNQPNPRVAFILSGGFQTGPLVLRAALEASRGLIRSIGAQTMVFANHSRVAAPDLEILSQKARTEGVLYSKFDKDRFKIENGPGKLSIGYYDEVLERDLNLDFDLAVVDEVPAPDWEYQRLANTLGLAVQPDGSLQPDKVNALPTSGPRAGMFLVGAARGNSDLNGQVEEVTDAVLSIRNLLRHGTVEAPAGRVTVDRKKCTICLTCVRVCPQKAMEWHFRRPWANPLACTGCGTCASECPMNAIQLLNEEDDRYKAEITAAVTRSEEMPREILVFLCANSAGPALDSARLKGLAVSEGVRIIRVPCAGKIDPEFVLNAFRQGFDGVLLLSCFHDACYSQTGSDWLQHRVAHLHRLLDETGYDSRRLSQAAVAPSMAWEVIRCIQEAKEKVDGLGPNPLKVGARVRELLDRFTQRYDETFTLMT